MLPSLTEVVRELSQLSADQIAERFKDLGFKGVKGHPCACPVAHYLESIYGYFHVVANGTYISVDDDAVQLEVGNSIRSFIIRFDNGGYEELIGEWDETKSNIG